jgi:hypothetical protein
MHPMTTFILGVGVGCLSITGLHLLVVLAMASDRSEK